MKKVAFRMDGISGEMYSASANGTKPICLYLSGLPGSTGRNAGTFFFANKGFAVLQPQYMGTYDSDGAFTPSNTFDSVRKLNEIVNRGVIVDVKNNREIEMASAISVVFAHSFGCYVALRTLGSLPQVILTVLFAPTIGFGQRYGSFADPIVQIDYLKRGRPYTYRLGPRDEWQEHFQKDLTAKARDNRLIGKHNSQILAIVGGNDKNFDPRYISELIKEDGIKDGRRVADCLIVENGDHDIESLLTPSVERHIMNLLYGAGLVE